MYDALVRSVLYPLDRWRSGDAAESKYQRAFESSQYWPRERHLQETCVAFQRLLMHAYLHCPYYRKVLDEVGIHPRDIRTLEDVSKIPILEKPQIRSHRDDLVARNYPAKDLVLVLTGGSTETPLSFFVNRDRLRSRAAATWRHNAWAGWRVGDKYAAIWGRGRDATQQRWRSRLRNVLLERGLLLNSMCITENRMREFDRKLKAHRPRVLLAYTKSIVLFARFLRQEKIAPYQPNSIVVSAEVLEEHERVLLESVFGCQVFNRYGCCEMSVVSSECEQHAGMHVMAEGVYLEVVNNGRSASPGDMGEVVVTDLLNYGMPLIRYRNGDMATIAEGQCACGRGLPRLAQLAGRVTDFLVGSDGRLVSGVAFAIPVDRALGIGQVQVLQERLGHLLFKIAPPDRQPPPKQELDFLRDEAKACLGEDTAVDFEFVEHIPQEPSGKYRFCISKVNTGLANL